MKESDYSIKPLQSLSNVTGLTPAKGGDGRNKRRRPKKRSGDKPAFEDEQNESQGDHFDGLMENDADSHRIDYCA
jgi:hypothetical protein